MATPDNGIGEHIPFSYSVPLDAAEVRQALSNAGASAADLDRTPLTYLYLDAGRWGGAGKGVAPRQRNFGVVWGRWALLCDFVTDGTYFEPVLHADTGPINTLLAALTVRGKSAVRVIKSDWAPPSPLAPEPSWDKVYVFLPDLHLPVVTAEPQTADEAAMGRFGYGAASAGRLGPEQQHWYQQYLSSDIFQNAAEDLIRFVELLNRPVAGTVQLVQLGDMYDLWIGLDRFFEVRSDDQVLLVRDPDRFGVTAQQFVDYWIKRAAEAPGNGELLKAFSALEGSTSWLYGNHDCYLAAHTPPGLHQRSKFLLESGLFAEHGHRGDPSNRDGAASGQFITNQVFEFPFLRLMDPDRRRMFVHVSAKLALETRRDHPDKAFCVYVMGHTHSGHLSRVQINPASELEVAQAEQWLKDELKELVLRSPFHR